VLDIQLRPASHADYDFLYSLHRKTLIDYIDLTWGWEENWQQDYFKEHFRPAEIDIIQFEGENIGCINVQDEGDHIFLAYIAILPDYQRKGIGTLLVKRTLAEAKVRGIPVTLRVLRENPARDLYKRLGFEVVKTTDERIFMEAYPSNQ
jgi:ribosomal protein S18 acetylase RimI-like enzyme